MDKKSIITEIRKLTQMLKVLIADVENINSDPGTRKLLTLYTSLVSLEYSLMRGSE